MNTIAALSRAGSGPFSKKLVTAAALAMALTMPGPASALLPAVMPQIDSVMTIGGFPGNSKLLYAGIDIKSFDYSVSSSVTPFTDPRAEVYPVISDIVVHKPVDRTSPLLKNACVTGQHLPPITIYRRHTDADASDYLVVTLTDAVVTSCRMESDKEGGDEVVTFKFGKISEQFLGQSDPTSFTLDLMQKF